MLAEQAEAFVEGARLYAEPEVNGVVLPVYFEFVVEGNGLHLVEFVEAGAHLVVAAEAAAAHGKVAEGGDVFRYVFFEQGGAVFHEGEQLLAEGIKQVVLLQGIADDGACAVVQHPGSVGFGRFGRQQQGVIVEGAAGIGGERVFAHLNQHLKKQLLIGFVVGDEIEAVGFFGGYSGEVFVEIVDVGPGIGDAFVPVEDFEQGFKQFVPAGESGGAIEQVIAVVEEGATV